MNKKKYMPKKDAEKLFTEYTREKGWFEPSVRLEKLVTLKGRVDPTSELVAKIEEQIKVCYDKMGYRV